MAKRVQRTPSARAKSRATTSKPSKIRIAFRRYKMHALRTILFALFMTWMTVSFCLYFGAGAQAWFLTIFFGILVSSIFGPKPYR